MYNDWFMKFAPTAYRETRVRVTEDVETTLIASNNLIGLETQLLRDKPSILPTLRMSTCPPLAVDRLIGLAGVPDRLVECMEKEQRLPQRMPIVRADAELAKIVAIIRKMADPDIFVWLGRPTPPSQTEIHRAATIVADRLCGSVANPIIKNAQEKRQLAAIETWLKLRQYRPAAPGTRFDAMAPGTFAFRLNVPVNLQDGRSINIPVDAVVKPRDSKLKSMPILIEAKSAGDFTNVNKRRKEEATKMAQLRATYGPRVPFILFLCGYFDSGYLGYEAAEGIDWIWEHRIEELAALGL